jgi:hypothetical protein
MGSKPTGIPSKAKANADLDNPSSVWTSAIRESQTPNCIGWTINNAMQKTTALFAESVDMAITYLEKQAVFQLHSIFVKISQKRRALIKNSS